MLTLFASCESLLGAGLMIIADNREDDREDDPEYDPEDDPKTCGLCWFVRREENLQTLERIFQFLKV